MTSAVLQIEALSLGFMRSLDSAVRARAGPNPQPTALLNAQERIRESVLELAAACLGRWEVPTVEVTVTRSELFEAVKGEAYAEWRRACVLIDAAKVNSNFC